MTQAHRYLWTILKGLSITQFLSTSSKTSTARTAKTCTRRRTIRTRSLLIRKEQRIAWHGNLRTRTAKAIDILQKKGDSVNKGITIMKTRKCAILVLSDPTTNRNAHLSAKRDKPSKTKIKSRIISKSIKTKLLMPLPLSLELVNSNVSTVGVANYLMHWCLWIKSMTKKCRPINKNAAHS